MVSMRLPGPGTGEAALDQGHLHARAFVLQQGQVLDRARGWQQLEHDAIAGEDLAVDFAVAAVGPAFRAGGHHEALGRGWLDELVGDDEAKR